MVGILGIDNTNVENCGKKIEHTLRLKPRLHVPNFLLEMALQFQEIIVFPSQFLCVACFALAMQQRLKIAEKLKTLDILTIFLSANFTV